MNYPARTQLPCYVLVLQRESFITAPVAEQGPHVGRAKISETDYLGFFRYSALRKSDAKSGQWVVIGEYLSCLLFSW